jgi:hypothetical protein
VNWGAVAKGALNGVADTLVTIAPYAALAAAGLALLYAPTIIGGLVSLVTSLGTVATAVWGIATAIYATVGLPVLLVAAFTAMVAAAVIWRDDLKKAFGFDIVQAAQDGLNAIIGFFVGGFNAIKGVWGLLPAAFADIFTMAMNGAIDIVQNGVNGIIGALRGIPGLDGLAEADLSGFKGQLTGAAAEAGGIISTAMADAQGQNYVGAGIKFIQGAASGAADALHKLADGLKLTTDEDKKAAKEAKRQAEAYDDITRGARQRIEASQLEAQTLGMTTEQINAQRYAQELLNKAANDNIDLTAAQKGELTGLGAAMAAAEEATRRLTEIYDLGKSATQDFISTFKNDFQSGQGVIQSFGDAASKVLDDLANKALSMAANGIWDMIFNGTTTSGQTGGFLGSLFSGLGFGGGRAAGGPVTPGSIYRINENTPNSEYFAPAVPGYVIPSMPANNNAASSNVQVIVENHSGSPATTKREKGPGGQDILRVIVGAVARDMTSPGGQTNRAQRLGFGAQPVLTRR